MTSKVGRSEEERTVLTQGLTANDICIAFSIEVEHKGRVARQPWIMTRLKARPRRKGRHGGGYKYAKVVGVG